MALPSLYELADELQEALESLTDLDDQSVKDTLESLEGEFKLKTTNVAKYIKNLEHTAEGIKEVESRPHKRRTSIESKIKHLKEYLRYNLEKTNLVKLARINRKSIADAKYHLYSDFRKKDLSLDTVYIIPNLSHLRHLK